MRIRPLHAVFTLFYFCIWNITNTHNRPPMHPLFYTLLLLALAMPAHAHKLKVFAQATGDLVQGQVYFVGGAKAKGAEVHIKTANGHPLATVHTDENGRFSYQASQADDLLLEADSGDGHQANWTIKAQELEPAFASPDKHLASVQPEQTPSAEKTPSLPTQTQGDFQVLPIAELELAMARQLAPLREELAAERDARRLQDILGGLGYIFGLAGLALWWKRRQ